MRRVESAVIVVIASAEYIGDSNVSIAIDFGVGQIQHAVGVAVAVDTMVDVVVGMALVATVLGVGVSINVNMWLSAESFGRKNLGDSAR